MKTVVFSRSPLSIIFIQYNIVVARGTLQTHKLTAAAQKSLKSLRVLTTSMERSLSILSEKGGVTSMRQFLLQSEVCQFSDWKIYVVRKDTQTKKG